RITVEHHPLDEQFPEWGEGPYYTVELSNEITLQHLLTHLYVLIPVLDADKHYWVGKDEIEKLLRRGEGWLQSHPEREAIVSRYLRGQRKLTREALARLTEEESIDPDEEQEKKEEQELAIEAPIRLNDVRLQRVLSELKASGAKRILDLGCGEGKLMRELPAEMRIAESGTAIRTNQSIGVGRTAASASIWQTSDKITITPAWAWPARKKFCRSGFSMYPLPL